MFFGVFCVKKQKQIKILEKSILSIKKTWKINKAVGEYSILAAGILEHVDDFNNQNKDNTQFPMIQAVQALNLAPENWRVITKQDMRDSWGNQVGMFTRSGHFQLEIIQGKGNKKTSVKFCEAIIRDFAQPLSSVLYQAHFFVGIMLEAIISAINIALTVKTNAYEI